MANGETAAAEAAAARGSKPETWRARTRLVRGGLNRSQHMETAEALYMTSGYVYRSAEEAESAFATPRADRYVYSRFRNPTTAAFEERLRSIEGAEDCRATATGMAAVFGSMMCQLRSGDRVVASRALFGSCLHIVTEILPRFGIQSEVVDAADPEGWRRALAQTTKIVLLETPSNPMLEIVDLADVCELAHRAGAAVIVDNVFATGLLQRPLDFGADIVVYSATKHIDGQGRAMGGAVLGRRAFCEDVLGPFLRHTGPTISPFNSWLMLKGLESLDLRLRQHCESARLVAEALSRHPKLDRVLYPGLASHPQHQLARRQMADFGSVVTFSLRGGKAAAFQTLNRLGIIDISNNLGDSKSLICHPATTTHQRVPAAERQRLGITDSVVRLSVGLEDPADLIDDLRQALDGV
jgi:O-succinylhomoserine sulfhydrylase